MFLKSCRTDGQILSQWKDVSPLKTYQYLPEKVTLVEVATTPDFTGERPQRRALVDCQTVGTQQAGAAAKAPSFASSHFQAPVPGLPLPRCPVPAQVCVLQGACPLAALLTLDLGEFM